MKQRRLDCRFVGHIPSGVTPEEASDSGLGSIEHTETLFQGTFNPRVSREQTFATMATLFQRFARNGTFYTPTLIMYKASADWRDFAPHRQDRYVARSAHEKMLNAREASKKYPDLVTGRKQILSDLRTGEEGLDFVNAAALPVERQIKLTRELGSNSTKRSGISWK